MADSLPDSGSPPDISEKRTITQKTGLVIGLLAFLLVLWAPPVSAFNEWAAGRLAEPFSDADVREVANGAQATLALLVLMVVWWVTEAVPIPVTALLPGLMLPLLHVTGIDHGQLYPFTNTASFSGYANPVIYLFLAGFLLAGAMRKVGLDRRITLTVLSFRAVTRGPATILLGMMGITAVLSMWISNTATTAMMLPIAIGVLHELGERPGRSRFGCALMLGVAWAASLGGIGTIIGSPPNGIVVGILRSQGLAEIGFLQWMQWGIPVSILGVLVAWGLLLAIFRPRAAGISTIVQSLDEQRRSLGAWSRDEVVTMVVFALVVVLWVTQPFWRYLLSAPLYDRISRFGVYEIGLLCALLLFVIPTDLRSWRPVLNWRDSRYVDWGTLLLFGGGIALSNAMFKTGLTEWLASDWVAGIRTPPALLSLLLAVLVVDYLTEITSNTAVATMMTPIVIMLAPQLGLDPVTLSVACAMAASLAFMLPVATPPNALVYGTGYFSIGQMIRAGFLMNLLGCAVMILCTYFIAGRLFQALAV
jgi:sodium-dependent dicarboxylate transporter 2/3/5